MGVLQLRNVMWAAPSGHWIVGGVVATLGCPGLSDTT